MATSRYDTAAQTAATGNTNQTSSSTTNGSQTGTTNQTQTTDMANMSAEARAALEAYIAQLMGGGTQQMANDQAQRQNEINRTRALQAGYSKEAAFADAQGLISQTLRRALESQTATIVRAAEGAGTSQNAMRALLAQDAAQRAAESSSVAGLQAAGQYGQISSSLAGTLEALTRPNDTVADALAAAFNAAKGAVQYGTTNTTGTSTQTGSSTTTGTIDTTRTTGSGSNSGSGGMQTSYGARDSSPDLKYVGSTADTLNQLWGDTKFIDQLTF